MPSRSPGWFGLARPWSSRRREPSSFSTMRRVSSASWMVSSSFSRREGMKDSTIMSVSESRKMSLMNCSEPPRPTRPRPCRPTKCPWTSKTNSRPSRPSSAASGSRAAVRSSSKKPPRRPASALASLNASRVLAAPQAEIMKLRRSRPRRRAFSPACACASELARRLTASRGTGSNSPLEVESSLIGRRLPSGSDLAAMAKLLVMSPLLL